MQNTFVRAALCALILATASLQPLPLAAAPVRSDGLISEIDLRDITVGDALRILSTQYGFNVVASEKASRIKTALFLRNVRPMEVLDALSKAYNLWYQEDPNSKIVRIFTVDEFRLGQVDAVPEQTEIFTLRYPNATDVAYVIGNLYGERVQLGMASNQQEVSQELQSRFQRFNIIDRQRSGTLGGGASGGQGGGGGGGGGGLGGGGLGAGFGNTQNRNEKEAIEELMGNAKKFTEESSTQGLLAGNAAEGKSAMGEVMRQLSPIYVTVIRAQNRVLVRSRDPEAMGQIRALVKKLDVSQSTLLMEVKILSVDLSDSYQSAFDFFVKAGDFSLAGFPGIQPVPGRALLAAVVNQKFFANLQLLEQEGRVTTLATPMLMTANQEVSRVFVGQEVPITTGYNSSTSNSTTSTANVIGAVNTPILVPQTTTRPIGTTLLLTPNINADRTVNIRLLVEQSALSPNKAEIPIPSATNTNSFFTQGIPLAPVDIVNTRYFSGNVVGEDSVAMAVGGLIEDEASDQQSKTPVLGDIPGLGLLFRQDNSQRKRKELIIIIKPHIQETPSESAEDGQEFLRNESVHPNAKAMGGNLDIYRNPGRHHDDYQLQQRYKFYDNQDDFDEYHRRTRNPAEEPSMPPAAPPAFPPRVEPGAEASPQDYLGLTRFAAHAVRQGDAGKEPPQGIAEAGLVFADAVQVFTDDRVRAEPLESWKKGGLYVTTVQVRNGTAKTLAVDMGQLKGQWLASTLEHPKLAPKGKPGDSTYLYLVSGEPFHEALRR